MNMSKTFMLQRNPLTFPKPISSARMPLMPCSYSVPSQFKPFSWYSFNWAISIFGWLIVNWPDSEVGFWKLSSSESTDNRCSRSIVPVVNIDHSQSKGASPFDCGSNDRLSAEVLASLASSDPGRSCSLASLMASLFLRSNAACASNSCARFLASSIASWALCRACRYRLVWSSVNYLSLSIEQ